MQAQLLHHHDDLTVQLLQEQHGLPVLPGGGGHTGRHTVPPSHFRALLKAVIQDTLETQHRQDESREYQDVLDSFSMFGVTLPYDALRASCNLSPVANF